MQFLSESIGIEVQCDMCGQTFRFEVKATGMKRWMCGEQVNLAFPDLTEEQQMLLSNDTCIACFEGFTKPRGREGRGNDD